MAAITERLGAAFSALRGKSREAKTSIGDGAPAYTRVYLDGSLSQLKAQAVTPEVIDAALTALTGGNASDIGDVYDLVVAHPVVAAPRSQLKAGVRELPLELSPADDSSEAERIFDRVSARWNALESPTSVAFGGVPRPGATKAALIDGLTDHCCRGGGLTEPLWVRDASEWTWAGFQTIPQRRLRWDRDTGEIGFAFDAWDYRGVPLSAFPFGTFIPVVVDAGVTDFAKRGMDRRILTDWYGLLNSSGWWAQDLENYGSPILHGKAKKGSEAFSSLSTAFQRMGALARIITDPAAEITPINRSVVPVSPHGKYEDSRERRIAANYLTSSQSVQIEEGTGSLASASVQAEAAQVQIRDVGSIVREAIQTYALGAFVALNFGADKVHLTPRLGVARQREDRARVLDELAKAKALGLALDTQEVYARLGWTMPASMPAIIFGPSAEPAAAPLEPGLKAVA